MSEKELERILKAFANKRRIAIIHYIKSKGRASVGDIARAIKLSFRATSKHLSILSAVDVVDKDQVSLNVLYFLSKTQSSFSKKLLSIL